RYRRGGGRRGMTAVVALTHRKRVYLAADSLIVDGEQRVMSAAPKAWRAGSFVIGCAGSIAYLAALGSIRWPDRVDGVWPVMIRALASYEVNKDEGEAIIGSAGKIWCASSCIFPIADPQVAIGSGGAYAAGALAALRGAPEARVRSAIRIASRWCSSVG